MTNEDRVHEYPKINSDLDEQDPLARYEHRNAATRHAMHWLKPNENLTHEGAVLVAGIIWEMAEQLVQVLEDGIELSAGLRKLREAKDCFVIQSLEDD